MSILTVNLKHFYQRRGLWFWYLILAVQLPVVFMPTWRQGNGSFAAYLLVSFFFGMVVAILVRDILTKAFAYCLPGHDQVPKRLLLRVGIAVNAVMSLVWPLYPAESAGEPIMLLLAGTGAGMMAYWGGVLLSLGSSNALAMLGFLPLLIIVSGLLGVGKVVESVIAGQPLIVGAAGAAVSFYAWRRLGREGLSREYCGKVWMEVLDGWNFKKVQRYNQAKALDKMERKGGALVDRLEGFFKGKIAGYDYGAMGRYVWGSMYATIGKSIITARLGAFMFGVLFLAVWFGYSGGRSMESIVFITPAMGAIQLDLLDSRNMLLGRGREERYRGAIVSGFVLTVLGTVFVCGAAIGSVVIRPVMPEINLKGMALSYGGINWRYLYVTLAVMPAALAIGTVFRHRIVLKMVVVIGVMQVCIFSWVFFKLSGITIPFGQGMKALVVLASWWGSWYILSRHCMRGDLVGPKD